MASIPSNYEINVAKKLNPDDKYGIDLCKIQLPGDIWNDKLAEEQLKFFRELFGEEYHLSMTHWECIGKHQEEWE